MVFLSALSTRISIAFLPPSLLLRPSTSASTGSLFRSIHIPKGRSGAFCRASASPTDTLRPTSSEFSTLTVYELKDLLRSKKLKVSGKKSALIQRLSSFEQPPAARPENSNNDNVVSNNDASNGPDFHDIGVPPRLVTRLSEMGLVNPTPIQREAIPLAMQGRDVMGLAQTGTGKTLAFGVPLVTQMLEMAPSARPRSKAIRGLILAPTRELANQIAVQLRSLTETTPISTMVVVGGQNIQTQINKLKSGKDLLVATPGRLLDLMDRRALFLGDTTFLVLDEADLMLDLGFSPSLKKIAKMLPPKRQTMLFSATMSKNMNEISKAYLSRPVRVEVARAGKTADKVTQELHFIAKADKGQKLVQLLRNHKEDRTIVFGRTKHGMEKLSKKLIDAGFQAGSIHGNKSQPQRDRAIKAFKSGDIKVLVATDVAARGLDIPDVKYIYNYELPNVPEAYVHRIGRTARAGKEGTAIAFCSMEEMDDLSDIEKVMGVVIPVVSGIPWRKHETKLEKERIKETKAIQQKARRKPTPKADTNATSKKAGTYTTYGKKKKKPTAGSPTKVAGPRYKSTSAGRGPQLKKKLAPR